MIVLYVVAIIILRSLLLRIVSIDLIFLLLNNLLQFSSNRGIRFFEIFYLLYLFCSLYALLVKLDFLKYFAPYIYFVALMFYYLKSR